MWTPKRIILLAGGFLLFTLVYLIYSLTSLGRINTLPPLPEQYRAPDVGEPQRIIHVDRRFKKTPLEQKLEMAFNRDCKELKWPVLLELSSKSMVMAAGRFEIVEDGRVLLEPMSLALFGKKKDDGRDLEINTLKCKQAYLRFDRRITSFSPSELNGRKIVEAELFGDLETPILITNNRRTTAVREDDLVVTINNGPLYYIEKSQLVKTSDHIRILDGDKTLKDGRLIPPRAVVDAKGMEMELATSAPPPRPGVFHAAKPKNESISGVKRIILKEDVIMYLYVAGGAPLPGNNKANGVEGAGGAPRSTPQPARVRIGCPGRFEYELFKDHDMARFDVPADADQSNSPQDITVERFNEQKGNDMLVCKHLELRLKRHNTDASPAPGVAAERRDAGAAEQGVEIETAHATGPFVTLTSDSEKLDAHGTDFFHDTGKKLTILKGTPCMEANKEDSLIRAPEMRIQEVPLPAASSPPGGSIGKGANQAAKTYQQVQASGPGSIDMMSKITGKPSVHAEWKDKLVSTRDGALDLLILLGSACFIDEEHEQSLKAETLKVWLLAEEKKPEAPAAAKDPTKAKPADAAKGPATPAQGRRPYRVEALRNVLAHSAELNIHDAARLVVLITDVPPERMPPPSGSDKPGARQPDNKAAAAPPAQVAAPNHPSGPNRPPTAAAPNRPSSGPQPAPKAPRPIDLSATSIEAKVLRCEERMALDHLWAEGGALDNLDKRGGVIVRQEPGEKPGEEGVYIEGNTLDMSCTADGNKLHVTGDLARLKMDKIFILGPEVNIDQVKNRAWVDGEGAMQMQSDKTMDGKPLARPVPLTIHWSQSMVFFGAFAEFQGGIQAEQENARLACQHLQVMFDRPISLKEGMRGDQPAKVSKLVADKGGTDQDVRAEDQVFEDGKLQKYQLLMGREIHMSTVPRDDVPHQPGKSNDANEVTLYGPGSVRIMQQGDADLTVTPGKPAPNQTAPLDRRPAAPADRRDAGPAAKGQEKKLTYIRFEKQMRASTRNNVASFWEAVRVLNLPCDNPHREIDLDTMLATELPVGAMYLRSDQLKVGTYQRQIRDSKGKVQMRTYQEMDARGHVYVLGREFTAQCDHMTFNEEKDQVIFIGEGGNEAVLSKSDVKGDRPKTIYAKKIIYYRSTGKIDIPELRSFGG